MISVLAAFAIALTAWTADASTSKAERSSVFAGEARSFDELPPVLHGVDSFRSHRDLLAVDLDSAAYDRVRSEYDETSGALTAALQQRFDSEVEISLLSASRDRELGALGAATARRDSFAGVADELSDSIGDLAAEVFMGADPGAVLATLEDPAAANEQQRDRALTVAAVNSLVAERNAALENVERAEASRITASNRIDEIDQQLALATERVAQSTDTSAQLGPVLAEQREGVETERALAGVRGTDFSLVALDAYYRAAATRAEIDPTCGIEWWGLAGISRVEGRHGTFGGSTLDASGTSDPPIVGIPLDGSNGTALIRDSDGGAYDGDPSIDRAVGPMQFIPDTWRRYAADGNGDGDSSPQNMYDATAAAASYLCSSSRSLSSDEGLRAAYFSYNRSEAYVNNVLSQARNYQALLTIGDRSG